MKSAKEWLNEVGETVMLSAFAGGKPPGKEVEHLIHRIQADALMEAANIVDEARGEEFDLRSIRDSIKFKAQELGQPDYEH